MTLVTHSKGDARGQTSTDPARRSHSKCHGRDIRVSFLAPGLAEAVEQEARQRGIPVEVVEPEI
jgi:hypothetical protein